MPKEPNKHSDPYKTPLRLMKLAAIVCAFLLLLSVSGCVASGSVTDMCLGWQPIYVSKDDILTDETARQVLAHNEVGAKLCGW